MIRKLVFFTVAAVLATPGHPVRADDEPLLWPNGTVTYRDWGLYRPGVPVFVDGPYVMPRNVRYGTGEYFPSNRGDVNAYKMPPPVKAAPPEPYFRSWGTQSDMTPMPDATQNYGPFDQPSVIYAPGHEHNHDRKPDHHSGHNQRHFAGKIR